MPERGPLPGPAGALAEPVYRAAVRARNRRFDRGRRVTRLPVPVVSVGNLSVGGTGKTPFVAMVAQILRDAGIPVAIAMRGYKARAGADADEAAEYRDRFGDDVPVIAHPDRARAIAAFLRERPGPRCIVLDDGFQHRFVHRDLDIVLLDATRSPFDDRCLPRGWLREPVESLARAGLVALTRADAVGEDTLRTIERAVAGVTDAPTLRAAHAWEGFDVDAHTREPPGWIQGKRVVVACAIGNPRAFLEQLTRAGADVAASLVRRDHHRWTDADLRRLARHIETAGGPARVDALVTTGKDWVKLRDLPRDADPRTTLGLPIARPRLRMRILSDPEVLRRRVLQAASDLLCTQRQAHQP